MASRRKRVRVTQAQIERAEQIVVRKIREYTNPAFYSSKSIYDAAVELAKYIKSHPKEEW